MSEQEKAVPLLSAEMAELIAEWIDDPHDCVKAIASGAAVVIPATERVDVEQVRAVIKKLDEHGDWWCQGIAAELTAAIGDKK